MYQCLNVVCLRTVNYSDDAAILSAYSRELGRVSFKVPSASTREGRRRKALTMPLGLVECMADVRPGRDIFAMRDVRPLSLMSPAASGCPVKMSVAVFLAETLGVLLRESAPDESMFDFIAESVDTLSRQQRGVANFHLMFLYRLSRFLGIEPDLAGYSPGMVFDMRDGSFRSSPPLHRHYLDAQDTRAVLMLERMTADNLHLFRLDRHRRNAILDAILSYYSLHLGVRLEELASPGVLRGLF